MLWFDLSNLLSLKQNIEIAFTHLNFDISNAHQISMSLLFLSISILI